MLVKPKSACVKKKMRYDAQGFFFVCMKSGYITLTSKQQGDMHLPE